MYPLWGATLIWIMESISAAQRQVFDHSFFCSRTS